MRDHRASTFSPVTRRTALTGLGAGVLGLALASVRRRAAAQDDPAAELQYADDVVYGTVAGSELLLNIVRPADRPDARPAVVVIHGGGLVQGTRWDHGEAAVALAEAGYVTFSIEYRLFDPAAPTTRWPAQLDDAQRAVRWVRANAAAYNVDPERIGAFGFSSGGQLAAFLGTRETRDNDDPALAEYSSKATSVVTLGGLFDFTFPDAHPGAAELDAEILGGSVAAPPSAAAYADFSPISFVDATSAPFLILQEGNPEVIPFAQPERMVAALEAAGVEVTYRVFPDATHETWFAWEPAAAETLAFFGEQLQPEV